MLRITGRMMPDAGLSIPNNFYICAMIPVLNSKFIIDGVPRELTPAGLLAPVLEKLPEAESPGGVFMDETMDPAPGAIVTGGADIFSLLGALDGGQRRIPVPFAAPCTRGRIAETLIDTLWRKGNIRLDDLHLTVKWTCNPAKVGDMAAFYDSVESAADYLDTLGTLLRRCSCEEGDFGVRFATPFSGAPLLVPDTFADDPQSWIVYVPFETSDYRLGGSLLAQTLGQHGGTAPQVDDPDYFMDCFEVVRELAEDGVLLSASTVGAGGLLKAMDGMTREGVGASADISGIIRSSGENDPVRILFSELPAAIIQVRDPDFDYIDAEFLLQDVAFFPLGHPVRGGGLQLATSARSGIQDILESLMQNAEGED